MIKHRCHYLRMTMIMIMVIVVIMSILFLSIFFHADPTFISSSYVPSEEKVYFFFSEVGREYDFIDKLTVSRVAQVCTVRQLCVVFHTSTCVCVCVCVSSFLCLCVAVCVKRSACVCVC